MDTKASFEHVLESLNSDFLSRVVLASLEVIALLNTRHFLLYEGFQTGAGGDRSSGADLLTESVFCKFLLPHYNIDSEESGFIKGNSRADTTVILDPLDGSSNFKSNIPYYGASLAVCDFSGKVLEACVINYVSREIAYLNEELLLFMKTPCVFQLETHSIKHLNTIEKMQTETCINQDLLGKYKEVLFHNAIDFATLFSHGEIAQKKANNEEITQKELFAYMQKIYNEIQCTQRELPVFTKEFLQALFSANILAFYEQRVVHGFLECGIFEKANRYYEWVDFLYKNGYKFRSLGATALSLGFSFRYSFVLLPRQVRKYDGMAGFYLAQNQIIYGNIQEYSMAIPVLRNGIKDVQHIIITANLDIANKFIGW